LATPWRSERSLSATSRLLPSRPITSILVGVSCALMRSADPDVAGNPCSSARASRRRVGRGEADRAVLRPGALLAVTQLPRQLVGDLTLRGASETLPLLAISKAWNYASWVTTYFDPRQAARAADAGRGDARESDHVIADAPPARSSCAPIESHLASNMLFGHGRAKLAAHKGTGPRPAGLVRLRREGHDRRRAGGDPAQRPSWLGGLLPCVRRASVRCAPQTGGS
jgi:hypothetical protein